MDQKIFSGPGNHTSDDDLSSLLEGGKTLRKGHRRSQSDGMGEAIRSENETDEDYTNEMADRNLATINVLNKALEVQERQNTLFKDLTRTSQFQDATILCLQAEVQQKEFQLAKKDLFIKRLEESSRASVQDPKKGSFAIRQLWDDLQQIRNENDQLKIELEESNEATKKLEFKTIVLEENHLRDKKIKEENNSTGDDTENKQLKISLSMSQEAVKSLQATVESLDSMREQLSEATKQQKSDIHTLRGQLTRKDSTILELQNTSCVTANQIEALAASNRHFESNLKESQESVKNLRATVNRLVNIRQDNEDEIKLQESKIDQFQASLDEKNDAIRQLETDFHQAKEDIKDRDLAIAALKQSRKNTKKIRKDQDSELETKANKIHQQDSTIKTLKEELQKKSSALKKLQDSIKVEHSAHQTSRGELKKTNCAIARLQDDLKEKDAIVKELHADIEQKELIVEQLKNNLGEIGLATEQLQGALIAEQLRTGQLQNILERIEASAAGGRSNIVEPLGRPEDRNPVQPDSSHAPESCTSTPQQPLLTPEDLSPVFHQARENHSPLHLQSPEDLSPVHKEHFQTVKDCSLVLFRTLEDTSPEPESSHTPKNHPPAQRKLLQTPENRSLAPPEHMEDTSETPSAINMSDETRPGETIEAAETLLGLGLDAVHWGVRWEVGPGHGGGTNSGTTVRAEDETADGPGWRRSSSSSEITLEEQEALDRLIAFRAACKSETEMATHTQATLPLPVLPEGWTGEKDFKVIGHLSAATQRTIEPVGPHFLAHARRARHKRTFSEDDRIQAQENAKKVEDDDSGEISEPEDPMMLSRDAKDWKSQDHYAVLGLSKYRYKATEDQIKRAHRKKVLRHHPDKKAAAGSTEDDSFFKCIQKATEVLLDPVKRRQFDSVDEHADVEPPSKKQAKGDKFYKLWAGVFKSEGRFSRVQPVPKFGDENSTKEDVDVFYNFFYNFDSWRSFEYQDEDVPDDNENRDQKRHMERKNNNARKKKKQEDTARLRKLVDDAMAGDERIKRFRQEANAVKNKKRFEKEAAEKKAKEEAEAAKQAAEKAAKEAEERAKVEKEQGKKAKEAAKAAVKKNRRVMKGSIKDANYFVSGDAPAATIDAVLNDVELIQGKIDADETAALASKLGGLKIAAEIKSVWSDEAKRLVDAGKIKAGDVKTLA